MRDVYYAETGGFSVPTVSCWGTKGRQDIIVAERVGDGNLPPVICIKGATVANCYTVCAEKIPAEKIPSKGRKFRPICINMAAFGKALSDSGSIGIYAGVRVGNVLKEKAPGHTLPPSIEEGNHLSLSIHHLVGMPVG